MAVTPNTEKISSAVTARPCIASFCQKTYTAIMIWPSTKHRMWFLTGLAKRGLMSVNHLGPMRSMPQAKMMRGNAR